MAVTSPGNPPPDLRPGDAVGGFVVEAKVGAGGMGVVYRARDESLGRTIALKVISPAFAADRGYRERFRRESRLAAQVEHPNAVPVYRAGQDGGRLYIAMRFVEGSDLRSVLEQRGPLALEETARVVAEVATALDAAHARGLIHRDIKPGNVLLGADGRAYITDFGLTLQIATGDGVTQSGGWVGTPAYAAPEQIRRGALDARTDVYALGAVLYHCLTGSVPFPVTSALDAISAHLFASPPRPTAVLADLPPGLDDVIARAMSKEPTTRYPSAGALAAATAAAIRGERVTSPTPGPRRTNLPPRPISVLGRERDLAALIEVCAGNHGRFVTVVGTGGVGKTTIALAAAHEQLDAFADGVFFVALEGLASADDVAGTIARTLDLQEAETWAKLAEYLRGRRALIVLDNFEHLLAAAEEVRNLPEVAPGVRLLLTSRVPLHVRGEYVYALEGLDSPPDDVGKPGALEAVSSVALLLERAQAAGARITLTDANAGAVAGLCTWLDGIPLAIELAAARLRVVDPAQLLLRLEQGRDALGSGMRDLPERQRGLRPVLDWTWELLATPARSLLMRLAVCSGGFSVELADAIAGYDTLDTLAALHDASLIRPQSDARLVMPPPVRLYALQRLRQAGQEHAAFREHAAALIAIAAPLEADSFRRLGMLMETLGPETLNIEAAMAWTRSHDRGLHAQLVAATASWAALVARSAGADAEFERAAAYAAEEDPRLLAQLRLGRVYALAPFGPIEHADVAVNDWRALGDGPQLVRALCSRANILAQLGERAGALADGDEALALAARAADDDLLDVAEYDRGQVLAVLGETREALTVLSRVAGRARPGSLAAIGAPSFLADAALEEQRFDVALGGYLVSLRENRRYWMPVNVAFQVEGIAMTLVRLKRSRDAAIAEAIAGRVRDEYSCPAAEQWRTQFERALLQVRDVLQPDELRATQAEARAMSIGEALDRVEAIAQRDAVP